MKSRARRGHAARLWVTAIGIGIVVAPTAHAQPIKPRFLVIVDTSGSMSVTDRTIGGVAWEIETHGDGSARHPGCDIDNNGLYDDSRLFQAKGALLDTFAAFGQAEFALGRYRMADVSQTCSADTDCPAGTYPGGGNPRNWTCIDPTHVAGTTRYCAVNHRLGCNHNGTCYDECTGAFDDGRPNAAGTNGCIRCAAPATDPYDIYSKGLECGQTPCNYPDCLGADVLVPFPAGSSNFSSLVEWLDGQESYPAGSNRELRANGSTPIAASLGAGLHWLTNLASTVGPGAGARASDPQASCRPYSVILITDGRESCDVRDGDPTTPGTQTDRALGGIQAAQALHAAGIRTYVIGFNVRPSDLSALNAMASAGNGQTCATRVFCCSGGTGANTCPAGSSSTGLCAGVTDGNSGGEYRYDACPTAAIVASNRAQLTARLGDIIAGSIPTPRCDCDATCDDEANAFPAKGTVCSVGRGRCKRFGTFHCNTAGNGVECRVTGSGGALGLCGGTLLQPGTPGTEVCGAAPGCPAGLTPEECADENCDGQIDEGLNCDCAARPEICNGLDDNCNGLTDEIPSIPCGLTIGECRAGMTVCENRGQGFQTYCTGEVGPSAEQCDARDNDCDGVTDGFGRACYPAATAGCTQAGSTWTCLGACQTGLQQCPANPSGGTNQFGACVGAITPRTEVACDGIDNDCDGLTDEGFGLGDPCYPSGASGCNLGTGTCTGACRIGTLQCDGGVVQCRNAVTPGEELCGDSIDNDCDGLTDTGLGACGPARGICQPGQYVCQGNQRVCVQPNGPMPETCNGLDDDCDGVTDNNLVEPMFQMDTPCGTNVGLCRAGLWRCIGGAPFCLGGIPPQTEVCNNLDDDCDGCTDCDMPCLMALGRTACPVPGSGQVCGSSVGECRPGTLLCVGGATSCVGGRAPGTEVCDNRDNDCNGFTDEADPALGTACYPLNQVGCNAAAQTCVGACRLGTTICAANGMGGKALACSNALGPTAEICDGRDNDCDGQTDEDFDVGAACDNGASGLCFARGTKICNGRGDGTTCSVTPPPISDEICDGIDNDCDGKVDGEDTDRPLPGVGIPCGSNVGECRVGITMCVGGRIVCDARGPEPEICDGLDNDCNGSVDEGLTPPSADCVPEGLPANAPIVGECRAGRFVCARGGNDVWGWQCREGRGPQPEECDGKDNDCDGVADDAAECPAGSQCIAGECTPRCTNDEFDCPAGRVCRDGYCVRSRCANVTCPAGQTCDEDGGCIDRCAGVVCPQGVTCSNGLCLGCQFTGCPAGQRCVINACEPDPCAAGRCPRGSYCRADGAEAVCVRDCLGVSCPAGQSCRDGACGADPCAGVTCQPGQYCDPAAGACRTSTCATMQAACPAGTACVETTQRCERNPCLDVQCQAGSTCRLTADGHAFCAWPPGTPPPAPPVVDRIASAGGGGTTCECRIGAAPGARRAGIPGGWLVLLLALAGGLRRRQAGRAARQPRDGGPR